MNQCDSKAWDDDKVGSMSLVTFSNQDVPSLGGTIWQYQLPLIQAMQYSNKVEQDLSYIRYVIDIVIQL